jgi:hypothetical protein
LCERSHLGGHIHCPYVGLVYAVRRVMRAVEVPEFGDVLDPIVRGE